MEKTVVFVGNEIKNVTSCIQNAIDEVNKNGGGKVTIPCGNYTIATIYLRSNVELHLEPGTILQGSTNINDYGHSSLPTRFSCSVGNVNMDWYYALIVVEKADNSVISGFGTIDGMGEYGKYFPNKDDEMMRRPFLINLYNTENFTIKDVTLKDSGMYAFFSMESNHILVSGIKIRTRKSGNGDGIDFDGGHDIIISDCDIDSGDDCVSPKTYTNTPVERMTITNCIFSSSWAGFRIGESTGDIRDVTISNCIFNCCNDAIKIQLMENALVENFYISNCIIRNCVRPFFITSSNFRLCKDAIGGVIPQNGKLRNINISDTYVEMPSNDFILPSRAPQIMYSQSLNAICGLSDNPIEDVTFNNVKFKFIGGHNGIIRYDCPEFVDVFDQYPEVNHLEGEIPASGFFIRNVKNIDFINCKMEVEGNDNRAVLFFDRSNGSIILTKAENNGEKVVEGYNSKINCLNNLTNIIYNEVDGLIGKQFENVINNSKVYREYARELAKKIDYCYPKTFDKLFDEYGNDEIVTIKPELDGEYYIYISRVLGEFDIFVDDNKVCEHKYKGDFRLFFTYVNDIILSKNSIVTIKFKNINEKGSYHGLYEPLCQNGMYGPIGFVKK